MDVIQDFLLGAAGFFLGALLVPRVGRWIVTLHEIAKSSNQSAGAARAARIASATVLHSGPWLLVAFAVFAYNVHSKGWARPLFIGVFVGAVYLIGISLYIVRKAKQRRKVNAA